MYITILDDGETWCLLNGCKVLEVPKDFFQLQDKDEWVKHNSSRGINICATHSPEFNGDLLIGIEENIEDDEEDYYSDDDEYDINDEYDSLPGLHLTP